MALALASCSSMKQMWDLKGIIVSANGEVYTGKAAEVSMDIKGGNLNFTFNATPDPVDNGYPVAINIDDSSVVSVLQSSSSPSQYTINGLKSGYTAVTASCSIYSFTFVVYVADTSHSITVAKLKQQRADDIAKQSSTEKTVESKSQSAEKKLSPITVKNAINGSEVFVAGKSVDIRVAWASDHEVTQAEYQSVMGVNPSNFKDTPASGEVQENRPVEKVSWYDAVVYCNKRSIQEGLTPCYTIKGSTDPAKWGAVPTTWSLKNKNDDWNVAKCDFSANGYRLPTDAEWEYLARGGNTSNSGQTTYSGSNERSSVAWYSDNSGNKTHEVKKKAKNAFGLYDMTGNVMEWCSDGFTDSDEWGNSVWMCYVRGGDFRSGDDYDTGAVSKRASFRPDLKYWYLGFRVVRSAN